MAGNHVYYFVPATGSWPEDKIGPYNSAEELERDRKAWAKAADGGHIYILTPNGRLSNSYPTACWDRPNIIDGEVEIRSYQIPAGAPVACDNCDWTGSTDDVVISISLALFAGEIVPAGACPHCGALAFLEV